VARLLVKKLVPEALPGEQMMETGVTTRFNYARLDESGSKVRIRLNSTQTGSRSGAKPSMSS
jgi:spermidine dehydrogenase